MTADVPFFEQVTTNLNDRTQYLKSIGNDTDLGIDENDNDTRLLMDVLLCMEQEGLRASDLWKLRRFTRLYGHELTRLAVGKLDGGRLLNLLVDVSIIIASRLSI
jgi:hypothetical protein